MNVEDIRKAIDDLIYFIRREDEGDFKTKIGNIKNKLLTSNVKYIQIYKLFEEYNVVKIAEAFEKSTKNGRFNRYKIISHLLGE